MDIPYLTRPDGTKFYPLILASIPALRPVGNNETITCEFSEDGGFKGDEIVNIVDGSEFGSDFIAVRWDLFPARIRAAATALRDRGQRGRFRITHLHGVLTITKP